MWKKLHRPRNPPAQNPSEAAEVEQSVGQRNLGYGDADTTEDASPGLPPLPFKSMEVEPHPEPRVTSSVYSHRDSVIDNTTHDNHYTQNNGSSRMDAHLPQSPDGSPPVSPLQGPQRTSEGSPNISPIDDKPGHFDKIRKEQSIANHPVSRKTVGSNRADGSKDGTQTPTQTQPDPSSNADSGTKWDAFSGEPTTNEGGKPALAKPGHLPVPTKPATQKSQFSFLAKGKELNKAGKKFLESRRHHAEDDPARAPPAREPWKGPSGRTAIVKPVEAAKNRGPQPLNLPPRKDSKPQPNRQPITSSSQASKSGISQAKEERPQETIIPVVPPKDDVQERPPHSRQTSARIDAEKPLPEPSHDDGDSTPKQSAEESGQSLSTRLERAGLNQQPVSRFSTTTYGTTEAASPPDSPRDFTTDKDAPPLPALPSHAQSRVRKAPSVVSRKPTPSVADTVKDLPCNPEEAQAGNRIDALRAKTNDLARRRGNINTIIHELTQVVQPSSAAYDMATRGEVKKTVDSLNDELALIKKEEHDVGMKLMRAYKKQEQDDFYGESSALWIKRVAS